jgi:hypothetical protein
MRRIVVNVDDFCDRDWGIMDHLFALREKYPGFKITLFTIPFRTSQAHLQEAKDTGWIELAVHGLHHSPREMLGLSKSAVLDGFSKIDFSVFARGFRAPYWLMNEETIDCCNQFRMWIAPHHTKNPLSWRALAKGGYYYPRDTDYFECWYAHTYDTKRELPGLLEKWPVEQEFAFVSEAVKIKLNLGAGINPLKDFINLDKQDLAAQFPDHDVRQCDIRDGLKMFGNNSVDAVTASHFWMYLKIDDYQKIISEVYRVLRVGGVLRVTEDDCDYRHQSYAVSETNPRMMKEELERAGFEAHEVRTHDGTPNETFWIDDSLVQEFHGFPPSVFHVEAVKR